MRLIPVLVLALLCASSAQAKEWVIDYANSSLAFTATQAGAPFTGTFGVYLVKTDFDPGHPDTSTLGVVIDMGSASTGDKQKDTALPQPEWFDSKLQDKAEFFGVRMKKVGGTRYLAEGKLSLKGKVKDVSLPFDMEPLNDGFRIKGSTTINRTDFDVGVGEWLSAAVIGHDVRIDVSLMAYEKK